MPSVGMHFVVCGQLCYSSTRKAFSVECKMTILSTRVHKCDVFHEDLMWLDADKGANFSCCASVDNKLATHAFPVIYELWVDCVGDSSSDEKRETCLTFNQ